jgi:glycosyltransferase involved in cell wall biosynthesis
VLALMEARSVTGPAKNLLAVARRLAEQGTGSIRIAAFTRGDDSRTFIQACEQAGVECEAIREERRFDRSVVPQLRALARRYAPDVLQSHATKSHFLIRLYGLNRGLPWVAFSHGYTAEDLTVRLYNQLDRWSLRAADRVVTVCEPFAERLRGFGIEARRLTVLHNPVPPFAAPPPEGVESLRRRLEIPAECLVLLSVGRFSAEKNQADLLRAAAALKRSGTPPFRLALVGDGPERERLRALSRELSLTDAVIFAGMTNDVSLYYSLADVFVLPSRSEGSPNVLLEAMASGLPVVATAVGGVPEIVRSKEQGILVPAGDAAALAGAIAQALNSRDLRESLGRSGREWVSGHHSPGAYTDSILAAYRELSSAGFA